jgi:serine/threonine protein kinase
MSGAILAGKYELVGTVGQGGMADVYLARDLVLKRQVALKLISANLARSPSAVVRFENEARLLASLDHEHIVTIFDFGQINNRPFLAMQFLEGHTLSDDIRQRGPWDIPRAAQLLSEIAAALDYAHGRGLLHRDVKPANIMVSPAGKATLTDFGIAKALAGAGMTEGLVGTARYMSPEQIQGTVVGPSSDIYSLGVLAFEVLSGRVPFEAEATISLINKVVNDEPPRLATIQSTIPDAISDVVQRALSKQPAMRHATAREFADAFAQAAEQAVTTRLTQERAVGVPRWSAPGESSYDDYSVAATRLTPALIIYLLDLSGSMSQSLGDRTRVEIVRDALRATLRQMVYRSTKGRIVSPRYRVAVLGYSDRVYDLVGGVKAVDQLAAQSFNPELNPLRTTDTARAFAEAAKILEAELPGLQRSPAPIVCHLTDGEFTGADPEPIAERIKHLRVADGHVLVENIFVSDAVVPRPIGDVGKWGGIGPETRLSNAYAEKLRRMSSVLPESYRSALTEFGFHLNPGAVMLLPGISPELVKLAFQVSGMTGTVSTS